MEGALGDPYGLVGNGKFGMTYRSIQPLMYLSVPTMRSATTSPIGMLIMPLPPPLVLPPESVWEAFMSVAASNAPSFGLLVTSLMVPPMEPAPYRVPCGPRNTSTLLRSNRSGSMTVRPLSDTADADSGVSSR